ncbi:MAG: cytidylate kinase-like family protein [Opitutae bacterium]|nr:cytidylate kinase-like family protein [Opitutae bacterium]
MSLPDALARTDSYFSAEWRGSRAPWVRKPTNIFVTISREAGSGGSSLAQLVAKQLAETDGSAVPWQVYGGNVVDRMLEANHLSDRLARFLPEDHVSELVASIGELVGLHPSLWELVQKTNETMRDLAKGGQVILVGRGANFATVGIAGGVHVRLIAPPENRARAWAEFKGIPEAEALAQIAKVDAARRRYASRTFNADQENPAAYDLVINTGLLPLAEAAALVAARVRARLAVAA